MRIDGKKITAEILADVRRRVSGLERVPVVRIVTVAPTPATESYLRIKTASAEAAGMQLEVLRFDEHASEEKIIEKINANGADAIVVQLPFPAHFDIQKILNAIPVEKDPDVLSASSYECFELGVMGSVLPPVVGAIAEILKRTNVEVEGKKVAVVGNGKLVGKPSSVWCEREGGMVTVVTRETGDIQAVLKDADIIISGAGTPNLITPDMIKEGVVLIDAGTTESGGTIVGDADPACEAIARVFTPVPGGVGPVSVACLFQNVADLLVD